jgi:hypothetical protein
MIELNKFTARLGKTIAFILTAAFIFAGCASTKPIATKAISLVPQTKQLAVGIVNVYDFGTVKLHAYNSQDALGDNCYLLETDKELVGIELLAFKNTIAEYEEYIKSLNKPLTALLISSHPDGGDYFLGLKVYGTANVLAAEQGGSIKALTDSFVTIFGDAFDPNLAMITDVIQPGKITIGGLDFEVSNDGDGMDIVIPAINSVYTHMFGSDVHNILPSIEAIDAMIAKAKDYQEKNYNLILSGHHPEEQISVAKAKIAYLEKTKSLASSSKTKVEFIADMKAAFTNYQGENYLEMSAGALFQE